VRATQGGYASALYPAILPCAPKTLSFYSHAMS
jgi:hypothetical protein